MSRFIFFMLYFVFFVGCHGDYNQISKSDDLEINNSIPEDKFLNTVALRLFYTDSLRDIDLNNSDFLNVQSKNDKYIIQVDDESSPEFIHLWKKGIQNSVSYIEIFRSRQIEKKPVMISYFFKINDSKDSYNDNNEMNIVISKLTKVSKRDVDILFIKYSESFKKYNDTNDLFSRRYYSNDLVFEFATDPTNDNLSFLYIYKK